MCSFVIEQGKNCFEYGCIVETERQMLERVLYNERVDIIAEARMFFLISLI